MIFKEVNLIAFGKFENKKLKLEKGLNLIYGENESGKSTIHSFIDGIFYGFLRPGVRTAVYLDEHKKYDPWNSNRYGGILKFKQEAREYRIEREFTKGKESTKVFEEDTGRDITKAINTGRGRILQPGLHFLGFNTRVFSNTISIKQLGTKTDDKLADEVTEKLINISTALDDEISIDDAIRELRSSIDEIGTERAHTKPYARNIKRIMELESEREKILLEKDEYDLYLQRQTNLLEELSREEERYMILRENLSRAKIMKKQKNLHEAQILSEEIRLIYLNMKEPSVYEESIEKDYNEYEEMEEEKSRILYNKRDRDLELLKKDYKSSQGEKKKNMAFISLGIVGSLVFLLIEKILFGIALILFLIYFVLQFIKWKNIGEDLHGEIYKMEKDEEIKDLNIKEIEKSQLELLKKYKVKNKIEFNGLVSRIHMEVFSREKSIREIFAKKDLLARILNNRRIEDLELELRNINIDMVETMDEDNLEENMEKSKDKITNLRLDLNGVETNLSILERGLSRLVQIEEEIHRKKEYKEDLDMKLQSLELAINTIEEISKDIHSQFAPAINKKVSNIVDKVTNGKYNKTRINEELKISVENPTTREIIDINSLSGGTIDQLYFALRFGIINSMVENRLPLILDDCFIQYDDNRLKKIIEFLGEIGEERQIILFTCHNREKRIMEEMGIDFNLINLS